MLREILTAKIGPVIHFQTGNISLMCPVYVILIVIVAAVIVRFTMKRRARKPPVRRSNSNEDTPQA